MWWWCWLTVASAQTRDELTPGADGAAEQLVVENTPGGAGVTADVGLQMGVTDRWTIAGPVPAVGYRIGRRGGLEAVLDVGAVSQEWYFTRRSTFAGLIGARLSFRAPLSNRIALLGSAQAGTRIFWLSEDGERFTFRPQPAEMGGSLGLGLQIARDVRLNPGVSVQGPLQPGSDGWRDGPVLGLGSVLTSSVRRLPLIQVQLSRKLTLDGYLSAERRAGRWERTSGAGLTYRF